LLLANAAATWAMCGVIWFVQLVHYPLFNRYAADSFREAMAAHQRRTTWVVVPPMVVELVTAVGLAVIRTGPAELAGVVLLTVIWLTTATVMVPLHDRLARGGPDRLVTRRLVVVNWLRTVAWTARGVLCLGMLAAGS
jgi:hypothetical protein